MAKPRIFISSTYYDLRNIRSDLERYIKERNFDPILNEKGHIAYASSSRLEEYCYKEIDNCDILISIIGGRFGSDSHAMEGYSISQKELKTAFDNGKQVYIFIEKSVLHEYRTYQSNKDNPEVIEKMKFSAVDNIKIYNFLDEVFALQKNNQYTGFETSSDIINYLQEQWAGLFQQLLSDASKQKDIRLIEELKDTAKTLNQLVTFLTSEKSKGNDAIKEILFSNHLLFKNIQINIGTKMRVYFTNFKEMNILMQVFGFKLKPDWISSFNDYEYESSTKRIVVSKELFLDDGKLKPIDPNEWKEDYCKASILKAPADLDDDLPF